MVISVAETRFDDWVADRYELLWPELFDPSVVNPVVDFLADLAGAGPVLEFGVGTGRLAVPSAERGISVAGIELSPAMAARVAERPSGAQVRLTIGDFATVRVDGVFGLVYLVRNTITNLTTQHEQVAVFQNAAEHLAPGGYFVVENYIPRLRRLRPGETTTVFTPTPNHLGYEVYDVAAQIAVSHHYWMLDGELKAFSSPHRYVWPSEFDLMAALAGLQRAGAYDVGSRFPRPPSPMRSVTDSDS